jgi:hypothetical protein
MTGDGTEPGDSMLAPLLRTLAHDLRNAAATGQTMLSLVKDSGVADAGTIGDLDLVGQGLRGVTEVARDLSLLGRAMAAPPDSAALAEVVAGAVARASRTLGVPVPSAPAIAEGLRVRGQRDLLIEAIERLIVLCAPVGSQSPGLSLVGGEAPALRVQVAAPAGGTGEGQVEWDAPETLRTLALVRFVVGAVAAGAVVELDGGRGVEVRLPPAGQGTGEGA